MNRFRLFCVVALTGLGLAVPAVAGAAAPAGLSGEVLTGAPAVSNLVCSIVQSHTEGSFDFTVSGVAAGPYPGTFTETGSVSLTAFAFTGFHAAFTITSPFGTVSGTKDLFVGAPQPYQGVFASCVSLNGIGDAVSLTGGAVTYDATITTPSGSATEHGTGTVSVTAEQDVGQLPTGTFSESFLGPLLPTTTGQCKDGGWQTFNGAFKNQGDCVSYVATGGKNTPAG